MTGTSLIANQLTASIEAGIDAYATQVAHGYLPAGKYHRLSGQRHLNDRAREAKQDPSFPFYFSGDQADRFFRFAQKLKHYKGEWAGQFIKLTDFQRFRLGSVFGWRHRETHLRRFTTAYNELPRKQGKSLEAAIVALYTTFFEGEPGAEGYCVATKEKQATDIVFRDIKSLINSSGLKHRLKVQVRNIHHEATASKLEPLGSDSETLDGLNPHSITTDELHGFKHRSLLDVLETATGSRRNPLHNQITTAGNDPVSVCGDQHHYAVQVLEGVLEDEAAQSFFACIAHADPEDDWTKEATWRKANPHYGISVKPDDLLKLAQKAMAMPSAAAEFKQKRLNLWVNTYAPSLSVDGWRKGQSQWDLDDLEHESCWVGIDLSSKIDLTSMSLVFPPRAGRSTWRVIQQIWTPEETLVDRAHRDRFPYQLMVDQGWLKTSPGTSIQQELLQDALTELRTRFDIELIGFDPWHADRLIEQLKKDGWGDEQVLEVPQTYASLTSTETRFKAEVLAGNVDARGCPVTAWAISNVIDDRDGKGNILFSKKRSRGRIDPVKSITIGMSLYLRQPPVEEPQFQAYVFGGHR